MATQSPACAVQLLFMLFPSQRSESATYSTLRRNAQTLDCSFTAVANPCRYLTVARSMMVAKGIICLLSMQETCHPTDYLELQGAES